MVFTVGNIQFLTKFEALYLGKAHYNMKEAWTLEVILAINLKMEVTRKQRVSFRRKSKKYYTNIDSVFSYGRKSLVGGKMDHLETIFNRPFFLSSSSLYDLTPRTSGQRNLREYFDNSKLAGEL